MFVERPGHELFAGAGDGSEGPLVEIAQFVVGASGGEFDGPEGVHEPAMDRAAGEGEVLHRPHRVQAVQGLGGHFARPEKIMFGAKGHRAIVYLSLIHISEPTRPY